MTHDNEKILTGLALSMLALWELDIAEIPLGLFSITHAEQTMLFTGITLLELLIATALLSRGIMKLAGKYTPHLKTRQTHPYHHVTAQGTRN